MSHVPRFLLYPLPKSAVAEGILNRQLNPF